MSYRLSPATIHEPVIVHVVMHRNGEPIHFDVTVDLVRLVAAIGPNAERNRSHRAVVAGGAVKVEHIP